MLNASGNIVLYQSVAANAVNSAQRAIQAIRQASAKVGVDFAYMLNSAIQESGLNSSAKSSSSSATGLYQFVEQTWLRMVKTYGEKYGLGEAANRITIGPDGVAKVTDPKSKKAILELRNDPQTSACMAAELTSENKETLECKTGIKVGATELYLAHFLGVSGAAAFINAMQSNPNAKAADLMPEAAKANESVFYGKDGQPRTLAQVYKKFAERFCKSPDAVVRSVVAASASSYHQPTTQQYIMEAKAETFDGHKEEIHSYLHGRSLKMNPYSFRSFSSSPFTTMVLAQMDTDSLFKLPSASSSSSNTDGRNKKQVSSAPKISS